MLNYCRWWGRRKTQLVSVLVLAVTILWMAFTLARSERWHRDVLREVREGFRREAAVRDAVMRAIRPPSSRALPPAKPVPR
ncbi:hypothetical protein OJF2_72670 [Aquisphaera giovannonii]|uniref:Uncharacterized protein n=1 Tax=Aquisphaera giovannonii TaxID=406548 RepID=A0A5B9WFC2_9BACT|nr:hypothetical protein [Aquisphaera giovannonii]QEH38661.1 hypothetical protein OJF2_72670 [Aquisphaera giovannonii]